MTASTTAAITGTALAAALEPDGTVLVVNASQTKGIAASLSNASVVAVLLIADE